MPGPIRPGKGSGANRPGPLRRLIFSAPKAGAGDKVSPSLKAPSPAEKSRGDTIRLRGSVINEVNAVLQVREGLPRAAEVVGIPQDSLIFGQGVVSFDWTSGKIPNLPHLAKLVGNRVNDEVADNPLLVIVEMLVQKNTGIVPDDALRGLYFTANRFNLRHDQGFLALKEYCRQHPISGSENLISGNSNLLIPE